MRTRADGSVGIQLRKAVVSTYTHMWRTTQSTWLTPTAPLLIAESSTILTPTPWWKKIWKLASEARAKIGTALGVIGTAIAVKKGYEKIDQTIDESNRNSSIQDNALSDNNPWVGVEEVTRYHENVPNSIAKGVEGASDILSAASEHIPVAGEVPGAIDSTYDYITCKRRHQRCF
jgi:hypothetical protein